MNIEQLAFADAKVESVSSCLQYCDIVLLDWREVRWRIRFDKVLSVENLNIEGEEIDRLEIKSGNEYVARVRSLVDEPDAEVKAYNFFIPWKSEPQLRVVAASCDAEEIGRDSTVVTNDSTAYISELDAWLPDGKAVYELRRIVEIDAGGCIEYDSGQRKVPANADYEVVSKALIKQPKELGFGSCFRVVVAIGGLIEDDTGIVKSKFGFATIWYDINGSLITTDFSEDTPI